MRAHSQLYTNLLRLTNDYYYKALPGEDLDRYWCWQEIMEQTWDKLPKFGQVLGSTRED